MDGFGFVWVQVGLSADRCGLVWVQVGLSTSGEDLQCCGLARSGFVVFVTFGVGIRGRIHGDCERRRVFEVIPVFGVKSESVQRFGVLGVCGGAAWCSSSFLASVHLLQFVFPSFQPRIKCLWMFDDFL
ncbi:unnamed protein product [Microthlaspi erraticum]|uniref:Uncharacterized protein n=1 Tax=Microthlaspi erraticum TaxID=1685480 RepID=A0A6D2HPK5_9BRAS|nr:unnamed protein product [Microthlaspi erraticum]